MEGMAKSSLVRIGINFMSIVRLCLQQYICFVPFNDKTTRISSVCAIRNELEWMHLHISLSKSKFNFLHDSWDALESFRIITCNLSIRDNNALVRFAIAPHQKCDPHGHGSIKYNPLSVDINMLCSGFPEIKGSTKICLPPLFYSESRVSVKCYFHFISLKFKVIFLIIIWVIHD
jgi:hypothetical protein